MKFTNLLSDQTALAELGRRMTEARLAKGWTQAQLAAEAGVSKSTVERLEAGGSSQLTNLLRALRALDRLDGFERLLPEATPSPIDLLQRRGKLRQRASGAAQTTPAAPPWRWDEPS
jgi:transcriptional regulator with XRE-family HTH domain